MPVFFREIDTGNIAEGADPELSPPGDWEVVDEGVAQKQRLVNQQLFEEASAQATQEVSDSIIQYQLNRFDNASSVLEDVLGISREDAESVTNAILGNIDSPPLTKEQK